MLYHAVWLAFDLTHLNRPVNLFFAGMMAWAIWRAVHFRRR
ncbi:hypothetical protein [Sulfobacillus harzensis]|nr:hypothetical protein [Sulfobacillus harzensis]